MSPSINPNPHRSNPHIRLNSNPDDLVIPDITDDHASPLAKTTAKKRRLTRLVPLQRDANSKKSLYSIEGTSAERLLIPPPPPRSTSVRRQQLAPAPRDPPKAKARPLYPSSRPDTEVEQDIGHGEIHNFPVVKQLQQGQEITPPSSSTYEASLNTQNVIEKFDFRPAPGFMLYPEDVETDDWLHNPKSKEPMKGRNFFSARGCVNVLGLTLITIGIFVLLIGYPVFVAYIHVASPYGTACTLDPNCIASGVPLLKNVRRSLIDPSTPVSAFKRVAWNGSVQSLVFSDEFNEDGRTFYAEDDAYFQAVDLWYGVTQDLEWYDPDAITTVNGTLTIQLEAFQNHEVNYRSGMLQSWNKMCFKGGYVEASISLPGSGNTIGFWPGFWTMGNLGRPGYASTTDGLWPYSYWDGCDYGITKNQSQSDGVSHLPGMRLPACTCAKADHPNQGKSRSAPEIDAVEGSVLYLDPPVGAAIGSASQSAQFAPFDIWYQPDYDFVAIYDDSVTSMNDYRGGVFQQAVSGVTNLNNSWYDGNQYQIYGFEYSPGATGYITWYVGQDPTWTLDARSVGPNGNVGQRVIAEEPLALVANFGMSGSFAALNFTGIAPLLPATMRIDYIRIYQEESAGSVTCDPEGYPTTQYIRDNPKAYLNWEETLWEDTGYEWPKNSFVDGCDM